jgi:hypothetical protein
MLLTMAVELPFDRVRASQNRTSKEPDTESGSPLGIAPASRLERGLHYRWNYLSHLPRVG